MNHEDWLVQADIYAIGALDGDELSAFEEHLAAGCPECEQHIRKTREALILLPQSLEPVAPPASLRERVLTQIAAEAAMSQPDMRLPRRRWGLMGVGALAAAGVLMALSVNLYQTWQELQQERGGVSVLRAELAQRDAALRTEQQEIQRIQALIASLQTAVAEREEALRAERQELKRATDMVAALQAELAIREERLEAERREQQRVESVAATLQNDLGELGNALRLLSAPQVRQVELVGLSPSPGASARLLWNPLARTGVLLTSGLPQTPRNRVYELWAIAGNEPVAAGIFEVDSAGHAILRLPRLAGSRRFDKFAVTLEPAGGLPKPTGPMHLLGSL